MIQPGVVILGISLSLLSGAVKDIEKAFFLNDAEVLLTKLSAKNHVLLSLPEPISFSDRLSREQTFFYFRRIFSSFSTFEFYTESDFSPSFAGDHCIFRARWSFKNIKTQHQHVFQVFFLLINEYSPPGSRPDTAAAQKPPDIWKIGEIRAYKG